MKEVKQLKQEVAYLRKECSGCKQKLNEVMKGESEKEPPIFYFDATADNISGMYIHCNQFNIRPADIQRRRYLPPYLEEPTIVRIVNDSEYNQGIKYSRVSPLVLLC